MQYRRIRKDSSAGVGAAILVGVGLGLAAGFFLGELFAGEGPRGVGRAISPWRRRPVTPTAAGLTDDLQVALAETIGPDARALRLVPVGRNALELHGWVASRVSRARTIRAARELLHPGIRLVDRLLVWGEDDRPAPEASLREPEPA